MWSRTTSLTPATRARSRVSRDTLKALGSRWTFTKAEATARTTFEEGGLAQDLPTVAIASTTLEAGVGILSLFVTAGLAGSNSEARRHVQGGAVRLNDEPIKDERYLVTMRDVTGDGIVKLSLGKKKHILVRPA